MRANIPAPFTKREQIAVNNAINREIRKKMLEEDKRLTRSLDAVILYTISVKYGKKKKALKDFYKSFVEFHQQLVDFYEMPGETAFICEQKLKEMGVDLEEWEKEFPIKHREEICL